MNHDIKYREAEESDIPGMVRLRGEQWGSEEYWQKRISGYRSGDLNPQQALAPRIMYVAMREGEVVGFIAGHLTRRFGCEGELEWINVTVGYRGSGISSTLLKLLAGWFVAQKALYICVNCAADNVVAQKFYKRHGAEVLNEHWLVWKDVRAVME